MPEPRSGERIDRAIDFALGILSPAEEQAVLEDARNDPEFESLLQRQCAEHERARANGFPGRPAAEYRRVGPRPRPWRIRAAGAAAVLVAASLGFLLWGRPTPPPEAFWIPVDVSRTTTRSSGPDSQSFRQAMQFYSDHDLDQAIAALQAVDAEGSSFDLRNLYLASAYWNSDRVNECCRVLGNIDVESLPYPWRDYARELQRLVRERLKSPGCATP